MLLVSNLYYHKNNVGFQDTCSNQAVIYDFMITQSFSIVIFQKLQIDQNVMLQSVVKGTFQSLVCRTRLDPNKLPCYLFINKIELDHETIGEPESLTGTRQDQSSCSISHFTTPRLLINGILSISQLVQLVISTCTFMCRIRST